MVKKALLSKKTRKTGRKVSWEQALAEKIAREGLPESIGFFCGEQQICDFIYNEKRIGRVDDWGKNYMLLRQIASGRPNFQSASEVVGILNIICGGKELIIKYGDIPLGKGLALVSDLDFEDGRGSSRSVDLFIGEKKLKNLIREHYGSDTEINEDNIEEMREMFFSDACHDKNCDTYLYIDGEGAVVIWADGSRFWLTNDKTKISYEMLEPDRMKL